MGEKVKGFHWICSPCGVAGGVEDEFFSDPVNLPLPGPWCPECFAKYEKTGKVPWRWRDAKGLDSYFVKKT